VTLARERRPERMDRTNADPGELKRSLGDLEEVNRWLGGRRTAVGLILGMAGRIVSRPVRVLDVATGAADIPLTLAAAARRRGIDLRITATDIHPTTLSYARARTVGESAVEVVEADALHLPYADDEFDLVSANTVLHHFDREGAMRVLREMDRVGRHGLMVSDLSRSWPALAGARLLAGTVWRSHPITRHDGPASVRAAFTPGEMAQMAAECLDDGWKVRRHPVFRLSLVLDRTVRP
jgi:SAM-dependent methyltransferase